MLRRDRVFHVFLLVALIFLSLAVTGAVRAYSPVPYWDMWDGYLGFFVKISAGDWTAWWAQHNEHRIALARTLFWLDLAWFGGAGWFLLIANFIFLALVGLVFWFALMENCPKHFRFVGLFLIVWLSSWSQENNLTWGFQSQFILAQLLPLSALYMLHTSLSKPEKGHSGFIAACFLGVMSLGSMANGVLALPLMTAYAAITRLTLWKVAVLAVLSLLGLLAYFYTYQPHSGHGSLLAALKENPWGLARYVLIYVGGPFFHILRGKAYALVVAQVAGGLFIAGTVYLAFRSLRKSGQSSLELAMLAFIFYVGATALGTAGGRLFLGLDQAHSSRYMTPALMAWAALFVILTPYIIRLAGHHRRRVWMPMLCMSVAMLPMQLTALQPKTAVLFERMVAALSLELRIKDQSQIGQVFPFSDWVLSLTEMPVANNLSIFGHPLIKDVHEQIGRKLPEPPSSGRECRGNVDSIEQIEGDRNFLRVHGWLFDQERKVTPQAIWLLDNDGVVIGYALLGSSRSVVTATIDSGAVNTGFKGYLLADGKGRHAILFDQESKCTLSVTLPASILVRK